MNMIDLILVKKNMLHYEEDARAVREWGHAFQIILFYSVKLGWRVHGLRGERE